MALLAALVVLASGCRPAPPTAENESLHAVEVRVGLERIGEAGIEPLTGRAGLVAHAASLTRDGRHAIEVLRDNRIELVRLFSPEHGLRGRAAAGEAVADGIDPESGLPVVSLYGARRQPSTEELADLDLLIFDLQDAGVRFYTYVSTLILCLEAAAEVGVELVVLDRPNPLGGLRVEGPPSARRDVVPASFVNMAPGPLVHGLTAGELALLVNSRREREGKVAARLRVVPMAGWSRDMEWSDTGRPWPSPSPNLRSPEAALAYPGVALLESTNVSEGRGSVAPFLRLGAPWLEGAGAQALEAITVPGFELKATRFVPVSSPAAPEPKFEDVQCHGVEVRVTDADAARPYELGVRLLDALRERPELEWRRGGEALIWLTGTDRLWAALQAGQTVDEILAADSADHESWLEEREPFLLYQAQR